MRLSPPPPPHPKPPTHKYLNTHKHQDTYIEGLAVVHTDTALLPAVSLVATQHPHLSGCIDRGIERPHEDTEASHPCAVHAEPEGQTHSGGGAHPGALQPGTVAREELAWGLNESVVTCSRKILTKNGLTLNCLVAVVNILNTQTHSCMEMTEFFFQKCTS